MILKRLLLLTLIAILLLAVAFGCTFGTTINGRIDQFVADLNSADRSTMYQNLDPSLEDYDALRTTSYWGDELTTGWFPLVDGGSEYSIYDTAIVDPDTGVAAVTAKIDGPTGFGSGWTIEFDLVKIDFDWFISSIIFDGTVLVPLP